MEFTINDDIHDNYIIKCNDDVDDTRLKWFYVIVLQMMLILHTRCYKNVIVLLMLILHARCYKNDYVKLNL